jgi:hypothetical protein
MVVVTPRRKEASAGIAPEGHLQPEDPMIKILTLIEIRDLKMDMTDIRSRRKTLPEAIRRLRKEILQMERFGGHRDLSAVPHPF